MSALRGQTCSAPTSPLGDLGGKKREKAFHHICGFRHIIGPSTDGNRVYVTFPQEMEEDLFFLRFAAPLLPWSSSDNLIIGRSAECSMRLRDLINRSFSCLCHFDPHRERLFEFGDVGNYQDQIEIILDAVDRCNQMLTTAGVLGPKTLIDK